MATTLTQTINWAQAFVRLQPLTGVGGVDNEPAITTANNVKQAVLSFAWPWNRNSVTFTVTAGQQDISVSVPDFGFPEKASVTAILHYNDTFGIDVNLVLHDARDQGRPAHIAPQGDDGAGNITFRLYPVPDGTYSVKLIYQKAATMFGSPSDSWNPIPDRLAYVYNSGFLASTYELTDDARFPIQMQQFSRYLVAANAVLDSTQTNIMLESRLISSRQSVDSNLAAQLGRQSRG